MAGSALRPIGRQMVLSDQNDCARLRPLLTLAGVHGETHFVSRCEFVETFVLNRIAMEVDFRTVACVDETIALIGHEPDNPAMARNLMCLDVSALAASMVLKLSAH